jgi:branched-chain amino acid transport system substrate-binding protein
MRGIDNQATMGAWVGKLVLKGAAGGMTDWTYQDGASFMPTEAEVKAVRKD